MSIAETLLILVIVLIVFGPKRLPEVAMLFGKLMLKINRFRDNLGETMDKQMKLVELENNNKKAELAKNEYEANEIKESD